jgi:hypothetical protein
MNLLKILTINFILVITAPNVISLIYSCYLIDPNIISFDSDTKDEKDFDDLEKYIVSQTSCLYKKKSIIFHYSFYINGFIDIDSEVVKPPPELT